MTDSISHLINQYNHLMSKDDVGSVKKMGLKLPPPSFTYGKSGGKDAEGAKEILTSWNFHRPSDDPFVPRDFRQLNKMGVHTGLHRSKDFSTFRKSHDALVKVRKGHTYLKLLLPEEDFAYGFPNRPSTPMGLVMSNSYGNQAAQIIGELYKSKIEHLSSLYSTRNTLQNPRLTYASTVRSAVAHEKLALMTSTSKQNVFKIRKFVNTKPRTDTKNPRFFALKSAKTQSEVTKPAGDQGTVAETISIIQGESNTQRPNDAREISN